jgi:GntR family transcriptional repressor for pyruvate dehydrogenase complex
VKLPKISKTRLVDKVVETLYQQISDGQILPGEKLPGELQLSESLGVGRPTVREAIGQLIGLGLLYRGKYGIHVADIPTQAVRSKLAPMLLENWEIRELYEARMIIEGEIAVLACIRATPKDIERLVELNELMHQQYDNEQHYWEIDQQFHQLLATIAGNQILRTVQNSITDLFRRYERSVNRLDHIRRQTYAWHNNLIDSCRKKDIEAVRKHIHQSLTESSNALASLRQHTFGEHTDEHTHP